MAVVFTVLMVMAVTPGRLTAISATRVLSHLWLWGCFPLMWILRFMRNSCGCMRQHTPYF